MISPRFALWARQTNRPVLSMVRDATQTAPVQEPMLYALVNVVPTAGQPIQVGRLHLGVAQCMDRLVALVVSENKEDIRFHRLRGFCDRVA